jgi:heme/copper-type cytochrome/quinol oxidase subunit 2
VPLAGFAGLLYAFPMPASSRMWMAAALGVGWPMVLALLLVGRKDRQAGRATFMHGNNLLESVWTIVPAIIFLFIAAYQYPVWAELRYPKQRPDNIMPIRVVARQFEWRFVYPGPDGKLDTPDDILFPNELHVVKGREVWVDLRSMDVLHSFFLPLHRVKQDVVPGLNIPVWFDTRQSTWEYQAEACDFTAGDILDPAGLSAGGSPALDLIKGRIGSSTDAERVSTDLNKLLDDVSLADPAIFDAKALSEDVRALWNSHPQGAKRRLLNRKLIDESLKSRVRPLGRQFDIICAELCGWGHYKMKGVMIVHETQEELDHWLAERYREQSEASR